MLFIVFFSFMIGLICRCQRLQRRRTGYVVVGGQNVIPGSVVTTNNAQIAQVSPSPLQIFVVTISERQSWDKHIDSMCSEVGASISGTGVGIRRASPQDK